MSCGRTCLSIIGLLFIVIVPGLWCAVSIRFELVNNVYGITLFQCVQLVLTILIGCWLSHVISTRYSKRERRINICCDSIDKMSQVVSTHGEVLLLYSADCEMQKERDPSVLVLGVFTNLSTELTFVKDSLENDAALGTKERVHHVNEIFNLLRTTREVITENALCNDKKGINNCSQMQAAARHFVDTMPVLLRKLKGSLLK